MLCRSSRRASHTSRKSRKTRTRSRRPLYGSDSAAAPAHIAGEFYDDAYEKNIIDELISTLENDTYYGPFIQRIKDLGQNIGKNAWIQNFSDPFSIERMQRFNETVEELAYFISVLFHNFKDEKLEKEISRDLSVLFTSESFLGTIRMFNEYDKKMLTEHEKFLKSTLQPSTLQPSTLQPSTLKPSTLQPSTLQPRAGHYVYEDYHNVELR